MSSFGRAARVAASKAVASSMAPIPTLTTRSMSTSSRQAGAFRSTPVSMLAETRYLTGQSYAQSLDLRNASVGQVLEVPYEITINEADRTAFHGTFYEYDRIYTSAPFAKSVGFDRAPMPFAFLLGHALSMSHVDSTRDVLDLGFENAVYVSPAYDGDTLKKHFTIKSLRGTKDSKNTIVTIRCELFNQHGSLIVCADKSMLFTGTALPSKYLPPAPASASGASNVPSKMLSTIADHANSLSFPATRPLTPGQCLLHLISAPLGVERHLSLLSSYRMAHPLLVNLTRYRTEELVIPGVTVAAMAHSTANRALFEVLHESIDKCSFVNKINPLDCVSGVTYIQSVRDLPGRSGASLAEVKAVTVGVKNLDVTKDLLNVQMPIKLFENTLRPSELEEMVDKECPVLRHRVVVVSSRTLIRQSIYSRNEQIPLL